MTVPTLIGTPVLSKPDCSVCVTVFDNILVSEESIILPAESFISFNFVIIILAVLLGDPVNVIFLTSPVKGTY